MKNKYYGKETEKALQNFPFTITNIRGELVYAAVQVKKAAARANNKCGRLSREIEMAITTACDEILLGKFDSQFTLPWLQGGAGTSINTNINEVIAGRASEISGKIIHPNDHVNLSQSTNDVMPSALRLALLNISRQFVREIKLLINELITKSNEFKDVVKLGRTHLQDAVPTTIGAEMSAYSEVVRHDLGKFEQSLESMYELNLGGTAIGTSVNASADYIFYVYEELEKITGVTFKPAKNLMAATGSLTDFAGVSQALVLFLLNFSKMAADLRLMSSGPAGGLGEISLPELQSGSTIMPGKVNPVIPETVNQLYFHISGNNVAIEHAVHAGQLELNVMFPLIAEKLISGIVLSAEVIKIFNEKCIKGIQVNRERCRELLEKSTAYATLLTPVLGYDAVSEIVKEAVANKITIRDVIIKKKLLATEILDRLIKSF